MRAGLGSFLVGALGAATAALALGPVGCGGGRTAVVGWGNGGNRIVESGALGEVAAALADLPQTPEVTDAMLAEIFPALLRRASAGDPEAALVVLLVAEEQRKDADG